MRSTLAILAIALVTAATTVALAQPATSPPSASQQAEARAQFERGKSLTTAGKYRDAYAAFEAGYRAAPLPAFLFNMGEAARQLGDLARARIAYARYLEADPAGPLAATARDRLTELGGAAPAAPEPGPAPARPSPAPTQPTTRPSSSSPPRLPPPRIKAEPTATDSRPTTTVMTLPPPRRATPLWQRWPVWAAVGGVVVAGAVVGYVVTREEPCGSGCVRL